MRGTCLTADLECYLTSLHQWAESCRHQAKGWPDEPDDALAGICRECGLDLRHLMGQRWQTTPVAFMVALGDFVRSIEIIGHSVTWPACGRLDAMAGLLDVIEDQLFDTLRRYHESG